MTQKQAYKLGVDSGSEAAEHGDFTPAELQNEEAFIEACFEICENKRQYAGHPGYTFTGQKNSDRGHQPRSRLLEVAQPD